jgi:integrase
MGAVKVVIVEPGSQLRIALERIEVMAHISPLAQGSLDEAFGFAVGARGVRPREAMTNAELSTGCAKVAAKRADIKNLAPYDLRRTCARLCHLAGGELEQIQYLLGHASVQTTERYPGCKQRLSQAVNDNLGLEDT